MPTYKHIFRPYIPMWYYQYYSLTFKIEHVECDSSDLIRASKICWTTCYRVTLQKFTRKREGCIGSTSVDDTFLDKLFISGRYTSSWGYPNCFDKLFRSNSNSKIVLKSTQHLLGHLLYYRVTLHTNNLGHAEVYLVSYIEWIMTWKWEVYLIL
jgi:hypothetical protein